MTREPKPVPPDDRRDGALAVIGGGAQAKYVLETFALLGRRVALVMDLETTPGIDWPRAYGVPVVGFDPEFGRLVEQGVAEVIVCAASPKEKAELWRQVERAGFGFASVIHPAATIASTATIGAGAIINAGAVIQPFVRIGRGVTIHANVGVDHDSVVGDFANLAPGATLAGWVRIGTGVTVFTGAVVTPRVEIGSNSVIAAGAVVTHDVPEGVLAAGVPAEVKKHPE